MDDSKREEEVQAGLQEDNTPGDVQHKEDNLNIEIEDQRSPVDVDDSNDWDDGGDWDDVATVDEGSSNAEVISKSPEDDNAGIVVSQTEAIATQPLEPADVPKSDPEAVMDIPKTPDIKDSESDAKNGEQLSQTEVGILDSPSKKRIEQELLKMKQADENKKRLERQTRKLEKARVLKELQKERLSAGVQILPNAERSKTKIDSFLKREIRSANKEGRKELQLETENYNSEISAKHGVSKRNIDFTELASDYYECKKLPIEMLPDHIKRALTSEEVADLRLVFEMFDPKGKGYISPTDLRRAAAMLGFAAKKSVFVEMIAEISKERSSRVTFVNFLDFIVSTQGEGPDPYEEIAQGFHRLDSSGKGFLTFEDIRVTADSLGLAFSNRAIREMMQEADRTGSGEISQEEFIHLMMQTNTFKTTITR